MVGVYRTRHPERTVLYRVLFHYFDRFLAESESRFEKQYGFFRFLTDCAVVDRIIDHLKLTFVTDSPPPHPHPHIAYQQVLFMIPGG